MFLPLLLAMARRGQKEESGSVARVYAEVNNERPKEYWDYESIVVEWGYAGRGGEGESEGGREGGERKTRG